MASSNKKGATNGGIGFLSILCLIFITLKLIGTIDWSWWWVLSPLWAPWALLGGIGILVLFGMGGWHLCKNFPFKESTPPSTPPPPTPPHSNFSQTLATDAEELYSPGLPLPPKPASGAGTAPKKKEKKEQDGHRHIDLE